MPKCLMTSDVRCFAGNNQKVNMCHNGNIICVDQSAVDAHLAHGDNVGSCPITLNKIGNVSMETESKPDLLVYPNPSAGDFIASIKISNNESSKGELQIINVSGQILKKVPVYN